MKKIILSFILFSCVCCNDLGPREDNKLVINQTLEKLLDSFLKENPCNECVHEIYIDKTFPRYYHIYIYQGQRSITIEENKTDSQQPLNFVIHSGIKFNLFSGVERYVNNVTYQEETTQAKKYVDTIARKDIIHNKMWFVKDSLGTITVIKDVPDLYPFFPLPVKLK